MMNCHQATRLMSEARERRLTLSEKIALGFHKSMCAGCKRFDGQLGFISEASRRYTRRGGSPDESPDSNNHPR